MANLPGDRCQAVKGLSATAAYPSHRPRPAAVTMAPVSRRAADLSDNSSRVPQRTALWQSARSKVREGRVAAQHSLPCSAVIDERGHLQKVRLSATPLVAGCRPCSVFSHPDAPAFPPFLPQKPCPQESHRILPWPSHRERRRLHPQ